MAGNNIQRAMVWRPIRSATNPMKSAPNTVPIIKLPANSDTSHDVAESDVRSFKITNPAATEIYPSRKGLTENRANGFKRENFDMMDVGQGKQTTNYEKDKNL